jgi:hypothetical protein
VTSLLYWHLKACCPDAAPQAVLEKLHAHFLESAANNLFLTAELLNILKLFDENGIPAIPFKGPVLAHTLYENLALRESSDLDILVEEQNVFRALQLLPAIGYKKIPTYAPRVEAEILKREYHFQTGKKNKIDLVEIHWDVVPRYLALPLSIEHWWERAVTVSIPPRAAANLSGEDLLMALSAHGSRHMWESLGWISDVARLLHSYPRLDWDYVFSKYSHPDLRRVLALALNVAHEVLDAEVPREILPVIKRDHAVSELTQEIRQNLFTKPDKQGGLRSIVFQLKLKSSCLNRMRLCSRVFSTPTMLEWGLSLPRILFPLYFVARPFRLLRKHLRRKNR